MVLTTWVHLNLWQIFLCFQCADDQSFCDGQADGSATCLDIDQYCDGNADCNDGHDEDSFFCGNFEWVSETTFPYQLTLGYEQTIFV